MQKIKRTFAVPTVEEIYRFCKHLFAKAQVLTLPTRTAE
jgi:hypothetical protein